ncbi:MAG: hypothetical protein H0V83_09315 [Rubrobacter sp.]|nr:hypothetical protein [Rubrobacter sp.]
MSDRDFVLLGIKYEAAKVGGMDEASLESIGDRSRIEVGEDWESNATILRGRDAVRDEHGLPKLGGLQQGPLDDTDCRPSWRRLLRRS